MSNKVAKFIPFKPFCPWSYLPFIKNTVAVMRLKKDVAKTTNKMTNPIQYSQVFTPLHSLIPSSLQGLHFGYESFCYFC